MAVDPHWSLDKQGEGNTEEARAVFNDTSATLTLTTSR